MVKILVFDTETTGLPPFQVKKSDYLEGTDMKPIYAAKKAEEKELEENPFSWKKYKESWPSIVQLSYVMFDSETNETTVVDDYIEMLPKFTTPEYLTDPTTHPITRAAIQSGLKAERVNIGESINKFMTFFKDANIVTGHNVTFDINMLLAECTRNDYTVIFDELFAAKSTNKIYCTACKATNIVNIYYPYANRGKDPPTVFKTPRLNQAYFRMFGYAPNETALHNALVDVVACLRVFYRLYENNNAVCGVGTPDIYIKLKDIVPINPIIQIIKDFTPAGVDPAGVGSTSLTICIPIEDSILTAEMANVNNIIQYGGSKNTKTKGRRTRKLKKLKKLKKFRKSRKSKKTRKYKV